MTLDDYFSVGETVTIGAHTFDAETIKEFAGKFDPQRFHVDEDEASRSELGGLCASGWHTASTWMKCNVAFRGAKRWEGPGAEPRFGPSPGFENLRWPKPVYAGETVSYTRRATGLRLAPTRPGWYLLSMHGEGIDSKGDKVLEFDSRVLVDGAGN